MDSKKSVLVVSAHASDFVWRAGGAIALYAKQGYRVRILCLSYGERGESERQRHVVKTQSAQSLADAHDGTGAPEADEFELSDAFTAYSAEDIGAVLGLMGLDEADLKDVLG